MWYVSPDVIVDLIGHYNYNGWSSRNALTVAPVLQFEQVIFPWISKRAGIPTNLHADHDALRTLLDAVHVKLVHLALDASNEDVRQLAAEDLRRVVFQLDSKLVRFGAQQ
jgi:hypothetical protein